MLVWSKSGRLLTWAVIIPLFLIVYGLPIGVQEVRGYKARPLDAIWATPPFLHNGSVPSLFHLLSPISERPARFWVGNFEFDPQHVRRADLGRHHRYAESLGIDVYPVLEILE